MSVLSEIAKNMNQLKKVEVVEPKDRAETSPLFAAMELQRANLKKVDKSAPIETKAPSDATPSLQSILQKAMSTRKNSLAGKKHQKTNDGETSSDDEKDEWGDSVTAEIKKNETETGTITPVPVQKVSADEEDKTLGLDNLIEKYNRIGRMQDLMDVIISINKDKMIRKLGFKNWSKHRQYNKHEFAEKLDAYIAKYHPQVAQQPSPKPNNRTSEEEKVEQPTPAQTVARVPVIQLEEIPLNNNQSVTHNTPVKTVNQESEQPQVPVVPPRPKRGPAAQTKTSHSTTPVVQKRAPPPIPERSKKDTSQPNKNSGTIPPPGQPQTVIKFLNALDVFMSRNLQPSASGTARSLMLTKGMASRNNQKLYLAELLVAYEGQIQNYFTAYFKTNNEEAEKYKSNCDFLAGHFLKFDGQKKGVYLLDLFTERVDIDLYSATHFAKIPVIASHSIHFSVDKQNPVAINMMFLQLMLDTQLTGRSLLLDQNDLNWNKQAFRDNIVSAFLIHYLNTSDPPIVSNFSNEDTNSENNRIMRSLTKDLFVSVYVNFMTRHSKLPIWDRLQGIFDTVLQGNAGYVEAVETPVLIVEEKSLLNEEEGEELPEKTVPVSAKPQPLPQTSAVKRLTLEQKIAAFRSLPPMNDLQQVKVLIRNLFEITSDPVISGDTTLLRWYSRLYMSAFKSEAYFKALYDAFTRNYPSNRSEVYAMPQILYLLKETNDDEVKRTYLLDLIDNLALEGPY